MRRPGLRLVAAAITAACVGLVSADRHAIQPLANGLARVPPMGWNTWNTFGCSIDEQLVEGMADALVSTGMRDHGYRYVVVDDCWFDPARDAAGNLRAAADRFPSGMKALGDHLHARGLLFGLYQVPATKTCAQYAGVYPGATGSGGHESQDARQFAAWGVDYLKYDWCSPEGSIEDQVVAFATMGRALTSTGRPIVLSINPNSIHATTGPLRDWRDVANLWRTTQDITDAWDTAATGGSLGIRNIVEANLPLASRAGPGGFGDPDMLEVGRAGLTATESRSHFALWAMMAAPLIAGNDLRTADAATLAVLENATLTAIDQDPLGRQATQISAQDGGRVLAKPLADGDIAVALYNESDTTRSITTTGRAIGVDAPALTLTEAWTGARTRTGGTITALVPAHGTVVYRARAGPPPG